MAFNLSDVRQTSDREAEELSIQSSSDGFPDRRLSDTRWTHEADDLAFNCASEFTYRQKFQDSILDVFEAIVIVVEDFDCMLD